MRRVRSRRIWVTPRDRRVAWTPQNFRTRVYPLFRWVQDGVTLAWESWCSWTEWRHASIVYGLTKAWRCVCGE